MATIQSVPKTQMTNSEIFNFCLLIINYLTKSNHSLLKFKSAFNLFLDAHKNFDNSLNKISKAVYWARVKVLRGKINEARSSFYNILLAESKSQEPDVKAAAADLLIMFKPFNKMARMRYDDKIRYLNKLIITCESDKYKKEIEIIEQEKRIVTFKKLHSEALELEDLLVDDEGINKRKRKSAVTRDELEDAYEKLVRRLISLAEIYGDKDYLELFAWWNALIDRYRVIIAQRTGSNRVGKTDDGKSSQHDPTTGPDQDEGGDDSGGDDSGGEDGDDEGGDGEGGGGEDDRPVIE